MSLAMKVVKARKAGAFGYPMVNPRAPRNGGITPYTGAMMNYRGREGQAGGIFGTIGNIVGGIGKVAGFIPGLGAIGTLGGVLGGAIGSLDKGSKTAGPAGISRGGSMMNLGGTGPGMGGSPGILSMPMMGGTPGYAPESPNYPVATAGGGTALAKCAPSGYHLNKSGYWSNESNLLPGASWTPAGTKLVRNRKRNPYNPKAASRAMSRLASLSQGMKTLERQLTKLAPRKRTSSCRTCTTRKK